jgi:hypothetical protein
MFDTFEPFQEVQKQNFTFNPLRYEIWIGGNMVGSGGTTALVVPVVPKGQLELPIKFVLLNTSLLLQQNDYLTFYARLSISIGSMGVSHSSFLHL